MLIDSKGAPLASQTTSIPFPTRASAWVGASREKGDQATAAHNAALSLTSGFCVEFWLYALAKIVNFPVIVCKGNINTAYQFLRDNPTDNMVWRVMQSSTQRNVVSAAVVTIGSWEHWAGDYDGATLRLVRNGASAGTLAVTGDISTNTGVLRVGGSEQALDANQGTHLIYDLRIWNISRSVATIAAERSTQVASNAAGLVANWLFNEGRGTQAADRTANAFHMTMRSQQWMNVAAPY